MFLSFVKLFSNQCSLPKWVVQWMDPLVVLSVACTKSWFAPLLLFEEFVDRDSRLAPTLLSVSLCLAYNLLGYAMDWIRNPSVIAGKSGNK